MPRPANETAKKLMNTGIIVGMTETELLISLILTFSFLPDN
jgi:hypothetical protein